VIKEGETNYIVDTKISISVGRSDWSVFVWQRFKNKNNTALVEKGK